MRLKLYSLWHNSLLYNRTWYEAQVALVDHRPVRKHSEEQKVGRYKRQKQEMLTLYPPFLCAADPSIVLVYTHERYASDENALLG